MHKNLDVGLISFVIVGGAYSVLVRRQLSSANQELSTSLAAIGEEAEDEDLENGAADENADLMKRTETGGQGRLQSLLCHILM